MREIKFRAWDKASSEFVDFDYMGGYAQFAIDRIGGITDITLPNAEKITGHEWHKSVGSDVVLMQFTGLKDKNGTEIYEGDIVTGDKPDFIENVIGEVKYSSLAFVYTGKKKDGNDWMMTITTPGYTQDKTIQVIGNIYQNPELLTDKNAH